MELCSFCGSRPADDAVDLAGGAVHICTPCLRLMEDPPPLPWERDHEPALHGLGLVDAEGA